MRSWYLIETLERSTTYLDAVYDDLPTPLNICTMRMDAPPSVDFKPVLSLERLPADGRFYLIEDIFQNQTVLSEYQFLVTDDYTLTAPQDLRAGQTIVSEMLFTEGMVTANPAKRVVEIAPPPYRYRVRFTDNSRMFFQNFILIVS